MEQVSRKEFIFLFFKFYVLYVVWITTLLFFLIGSVLVIIDFPNQFSYIYEEEFLNQWNTAQGFWNHFLLWNFKGLVLGFIGGLVGGLVLGFAWGLIGGLILGLGGGLILGLSEGIGVGLGLGIGVGLVGGPILGLIGGLAGGLGGGLVWSLVESFLRGIVENFGLEWQEIKDFFFSSGGVPVKFFFLTASFYLGNFRLVFFRIPLYAIDLFSLLFQKQFTNNPYFKDFVLFFPLPIDKTFKLQAKEFPLDRYNASFLRFNDECTQKFQKEFSKLVWFDYTHCFVLVTLITNVLQLRVYLASAKHKLKITKGSCYYEKFNDFFFSTFDCVLYTNKKGR